jgi:hypothetical protein
MRRFLIATTLAAALAPLAALEASAASRLVTPRNHTLGCKVSPSLIEVRNTTSQTIRAGTKITLNKQYEGVGGRISRTSATMTMKQALGPNQVHALKSTVGGLKSCSASVKLLPDYMRR